MSKKTVAIIGASADRRKFSNKSVRAHVQQNWEVYPVNPKGGEIEGLKAYSSVSDIPVSLDRVTIYLPPKLGVQLLPSIASVEPGEFMVNPGAESDELIQESRKLGLEPKLACSIVNIGLSPAQFPDE
ncbi:MAG: CoA-binding protein [Phycisphaerales bacterium]|nr:CoA-binding protein [Phycisphaerales bacterium]